MTSSLGFKATVGSALFMLGGGIHVTHSVNSGATPADLMVIYGQGLREVLDSAFQQKTEIYVSRVCLCWRCTRAGKSGNPDVVLLCWAFWVQGDLILIYYWGGLHSAAPTGGSPCSAVLRHLRVVNALARE